jgi:hypothetical protein
LRPGFWARGMQRVLARRRIRGRRAVPCEYLSESGHRPRHPGRSGTRAEEGGKPWRAMVGGVFCCPRACLGPRHLAVGVGFRTRPPTGRGSSGEREREMGDEAADQGLDQKRERLARKKGGRINCFWLQANASKSGVASCGAAGRRRGLTRPWAVRLIQRFNDSRVGDDGRIE